MYLIAEKGKILISVEKDGRAFAIIVVINNHLIFTQNYLFLHAHYVW